MAIAFPRKFTLGLVAVILLAFMTALGFSVNLSEDIGYVTLVADVLGPLGIVTAIICGVALARNVARQSNSRQGSGPAATFFALAALLAFLAWWLGNSSGRPEFYIAPAIAVILGIIARAYARDGLVPPPWIKFFLLGGAFIGGALPGLILYFILSLVVSDRYCQLTSSKCM
jgi:hypothetical protein